MTHCEPLSTLGNFVGVGLWLDSGWTLGWTSGRTGLNSRWDWVGLWVGPGGTWGWTGSDYGSDSELDWVGLGRIM